MGQASMGSSRPVCFLREPGGRGKQDNWGVRMRRIGIWQGSKQVGASRAACPS